MIKRVHLKISGKVQGVFFRAETKKQAKKLGLTGWVKNTDADKVEIVAQGEDGLLEEFLGWCCKGPSAGHVGAVHISLLRWLNGNTSGFTARGA